MSKIILFGCGEGAKIAYQYFRQDTEEEIAGFCVHRQQMKEAEFVGLPVVAFEEVESRFPPKEFKLFCSLGFDQMNHVRAKVFEEGKEKGYQFTSYIHSSNKPIGEFKMGENCFIMENQSINTGVTIGNNVTIWSANQIGNNCRIEDHAWISSHACIAGNVTIKEYSFIGINASISHNIVIERENYIGANALIAKNTEPKAVYVLSPTPKAGLGSDKFMHFLRETS